MPDREVPADLIIWRGRAFVLRPQGFFREAAIHRAKDPLRTET
jgi:hypothetical protein